MCDITLHLVQLATLNGSFVPNGSCIVLDLVSRIYYSLKIVDMNDMEEALKLSTARYRDTK